MNWVTENNLLNNEPIQRRITMSKETKSVKNIEEAIKLVQQGWNIVGIQLEKDEPSPFNKLSSEEKQNYFKRMFGK